MKQFFIVIFLVYCTIISSESQYRIGSNTQLASVNESIQQADIEDKRGISFIVPANKIKKLVKVLPFSEIVNKLFIPEQEGGHRFPISREWLRPAYYTLLFLYSLF